MSSERFAVTACFQLVLSAGHSSIAANELACFGSPQSRCGWNISERHDSSWWTCRMARGDSPAQHHLSPPRRSADRRMSATAPCRAERRRNVIPSRPIGTTFVNRIFETITTHQCIEIHTVVLELKHTPTRTHRHVRAHTRTTKHTNEHPNTRTHMRSRAHTHARANERTHTHTHVLQLIGCRPYMCKIIRKCGQICWIPINNASRHTTQSKPVPFEVGRGSHLRRAARNTCATRRRAIRVVWCWWHRVERHSGRHLFHGAAVDLFHVVLAVGGRQSPSTHGSSFSTRRLAAIEFVLVESASRFIVFLLSVVIPERLQGLVLYLRDGRCKARIGQVGCLHTREVGVGLPRLWQTASTGFRLFFFLEAVQKCRYDSTKYEHQVETVAEEDNYTLRMQLRSE